MIFTMIGSRDISESEFSLLKRISTLLTNKGYTGYSGGASGSDMAAYEGFLDSENTESKFKVFQPYVNFNHLPSDNKIAINCESLPNYYDAKVLLSKQVRLSNLDKFTMQAFTRNMYQILGENLDTSTTTDFVICCSEPSGTKGSVKGGTRIAVNLALSLDIPVYNIRDLESRKALGKVLFKGNTNE